ncbi:MAG: hypothetical protein LBI05_01315 [Planctomycetaceae bacterium]|nr:hypothetical protein [Planctomycetaceae bacterium]
METRQFKDSSEVMTERADYIAEEKFKQQQREIFLKSDRYLQSDRYKEYMKRKQAEQDNGTAEHK